MEASQNQNLLLAPTKAWILVLGAAHVLRLSRCLRRATLVDRPRLTNARGHFDSPKMTVWLRKVDIVSRTGWQGSCRRSTKVCVDRLWRLQPLSTMIGWTQGQQQNAARLDDRSKYIASTHNITSFSSPPPPVRPVTPSPLPPPKVS